MTLNMLHHNDHGSVARKDRAGRRL